MLRIIIADTSCFIILANIGELNILQKVYGRIVTTIEIATEYGHPLPDWVDIEKVKDKQAQQLLEIQIDRGESSAIALALEKTDCTVILDDYKARQIADRLNISYTGTIGVIIKAKIKGYIPSIKPFLEKISNTDFRVSEDILKQALREAGE